MWCIRTIIAIIFVMVTSVSCTTRTRVATYGGNYTSNDDQWVNKDEWYLAPAGTLSSTTGQWDEVEFIEVKNEKLKKAQAILQKFSIVNIEHSEVQDLASDSLKPVNGSKYFLVRAVYLNEATGSYKIYHSGSILWVHHGSLGRRPVLMKRSALIVQLKDSPGKVYVTCSMAE